MSAIPRLIIVVEDEPDIAALLRMGLSDVADVIVASTAEKALEHDWSGIDAAVVDVGLGPGATGSQLVDWIDENHPRVRVVILTAQPSWRLPKDQRARLLIKPASINEVRMRLLADD